jgi:CheY-like chemotaxis protein
VTDRAHGGRVLVCDDISYVVELVERWLGEAGFEVSGVTDCAEVVPLARAERPDLVIVDFSGPVLGCAVLDELRAAPATSEIPVIVMTHRSADANREFLCIEERGVSYIYKPFDSFRLGSIVRWALEPGERQASNRYAWVGDVVRRCAPAMDMELVFREERLVFGPPHYRLGWPLVRGSHCMLTVDCGQGAIRPRAMRYSLSGLCDEHEWPLLPLDEDALIAAIRKGRRFGTRSWYDQV